MVLLYSAGVSARGGGLSGLDLGVFLWPVTDTGTSASATEASNVAEIRTGRSVTSLRISM